MNAGQYLLHLHCMQAQVFVAHLLTWLPTLPTL